MKRGPRTHHVVPNSVGGWDVKRVVPIEPAATRILKRIRSIMGEKSAGIKKLNLGSTTGMEKLPVVTVRTRIPIHQRVKTIAFL